MSAEWMIAGTDRRFDLSAQDSAGAPADLTAAAITWELAARDYTRRLGAPLVSLAIGSGVTVTNAAGGLFRVDVPAAATLALAGEMVWEVQITTPALGTWALQQPITVLATPRVAI